jgi:hypothetical protein
MEITWNEIIWPYDLIPNIQDEIIFADWTSSKKEHGQKISSSWSWTTSLKRCRPPAISDSGHPGRPKKLFFYSKINPWGLPNWRNGPHSSSRQQRRRGFCIVVYGIQPFVKILLEKGSNDFIISTVWQKKTRSFRGGRRGWSGSKLFGGISSEGLLIFWISSENVFLLMKSHTVITIRKVRPPQPPLIHSQNVHIEIKLVF